MLRAPNAGRTKRIVRLLILLIFGGAAIYLARFTQHQRWPWERTAHRRSENSDNASNRLARLQAREDQADETVWAKEIVAENCGRVIELLWDSINGATNKMAALANFALPETILGQWRSCRELPHEIKLSESAGPGQTLGHAEWRPWIEHFAQQGWRIDNLEFRHNRFDLNEKGQPLQSRFYFAARVTNLTRVQRASIEGDLIVDWLAKSSLEPTAIKRIDASHLQIRSQEGEPAFRLILDETIAPAGRAPYIDPLIVYDLDGDGFSEIILPGSNSLFRRRDGERYEKEPLCRYPLDPVTTAVIADFDGDGTADLLCADRRGLWLFKGGSKGRFDDPARCVWTADPPLKSAIVLTCGDVNGDGALDVFVAQYRVPTLGQTIQPHYYDANDGFPAHLLLNDGKGEFRDVTEKAGLGPKRWRRIYSASLTDLDGDGQLDLATISDFAGVDLYHNDGHGHFIDMTSRWVAEPYGFGMASAVADFNGDGRLDLLMIGMPSPTAKRLDHLGLNRPYSADEPKRRPQMIYGNRLYLARADGGFEQTSMNESIARSGWSWGCTAFDFDNDGFADVYIGNGLETRQSVRDYESELWLHEFFIDEKVGEETATAYLLPKSNRTRGRGWSYGGYEKNRLYLNQQGQSFVEIGHLAGVALEQDSRNVVSDDLDGDGRMDLLLTTQEIWPQAKQTLRVYKNNLPDAGHWIGFRLREAPGVSAVGARVTIRYDSHTQLRQIVTGDSFRSQHASTVHFGLGGVARLDEARIEWLNGKSATLLDPAIDRYHSVAVAPP